MCEFEYDLDLHTNLMSLASRHNPKTNCNQLDEVIRKNHLKKLTVMMFEWELESVEEEYGAE